MRALMVTNGGCSAFRRPSPRRSRYLLRVEIRATLSADPRCVGEARRLTKRTLAAWGLDFLGDTACLLVSELTTNAILHARSAVEVVLQSQPTGVQVDVCDNSPLPPRVRHFSADAGTGRGVRLLDTLATDWGIEATTAGKCVWFTLSDTAPEAAAEWGFEFDFDAVEAL